MFKIKHFVRQSWLLIVSSFFFGLLIALTNAAWSGRIQQNKLDKLNRLMGALLPDAERFELATELTVKSARGKRTKSDIYKAVSGTSQCVGWAFNAVGPGFADKIELVVAVDENFETIEGFDCLASNETPGFGDRIKLPQWRSQFTGAPVEDLKLIKAGDAERIDSEIVAVTGATVSSEAVVRIINTFLMQTKGEIQKREPITDDK